MEERVMDQEISIKKDDIIRSIKEEMTRAKQENEKLKATLGQLMNDYKMLEKQYIHHKETNKEIKNQSVSLGPDMDYSTTFPNSRLDAISSKINQIKDFGLRLDGKYENANNAKNAHTSDLSRDDSFEEPIKFKKENDNEDEEIVPQPTVKRARVSVRAKCDTPTMSDGCQWRKYGQKIAKGNPCPRAYYRCTVASGCPVRKQVQRCLEDKSILITTYEGTHNHPLPSAASAMASTTSAAASMLLAGPTSSPLPIINPNLPILNPTYNNYTPNMLPYLSNQSNYNIYTSHNASLYSSSPSHPTITLDLTKPPMLSNNTPSFKSNYEHNNIGLMNHSYLPNSTPNASSFSSSQTMLTDTIAKALTTNPNFQSVLNAAITSYVGGQGAKSSTNISVGQGLKWGEHLALGSSTNNNNVNILESQGIDFLARSSSSCLDRGEKMETSKHFR